MSQHLAVPAQVGFELTIFVPLLSIASAGIIGPRHHACLDVPVFRIDRERAAGEEHG